MRAVGNLERLREAVASARATATAASRVADAPATTGIGHTRWATHGRVTEENAHPHFDTDGPRPRRRQRHRRELHRAASERLIADGRASSRSETDAEVIAHLIAAPPDDGDLVEAVRAAYAELARPLRVRRDAPPTSPTLLVGARKECPLIVGRGDGEQFLASAIPAFLARHAPRPVHRERRDRRRRAATASTFLTADGEPVEREIDEVDWDDETAEKGGYETFMLKEIHEQADAVAETIADRTARGDGVDLGDARRARRRRSCATSQRIVVVACGTSYHAGLIGRYAIEEWARVPVEMDIASEYRYRNPVVGPGRPRDRHHAVGRDRRHARRDAPRPRARRDACSRSRTSWARRPRATPTACSSRAPGLEIGVAATKTFVCQVAAMYLLGAAARRAARHAAGRARSPSSSPSSSASRTASTSCSSAVEPQVERDRRAHCDDATSSSTSAATSACRSRSRAR